MENYAGYLAFTDDQIARLVKDLERTGQLDNTLIIFIVGDNGASAEGGLEGTTNETAIAPRLRRRPRHRGKDV